MCKQATKPILQIVYISHNHSKHLQIQTIMADSMHISVSVYICRSFYIHTQRSICVHIHIGTYSTELTPIERSTEPTQKARTMRTEVCTENRNTEFNSSDNNTHLLRLAKKDFSFHLFTNAYTHTHTNTPSQICMFSVSLVEFKKNVFKYLKVWTTCRKYNFMGLQLSSFSR